MPIKSHIEKSYIRASRDKYQNYSCITSKKPTISIRYYQDRDSYKIFLSNSSIICNKLNDLNNFKDLITKDTSYMWKNDDLITIDKLPYIGRINKNSNILIGTGYNTWGITNGTIAGFLLRDIILNKENKYEKLFDPIRSNNIKYLKDYIYNLSCNLIGYVKSKIRKNKKWYSNVKIKNGIGIVKEDNKIYKISNKCPHMGCSLIYNEAEKTWDCPCHASRFALNGKCIKGPSKYDISIKND